MHTRMCPYTDCSRSTENGFARKENLRQHIRRRHPPGPKREVDLLQGDRRDKHNSKLKLEINQLRQEFKEQDQRLDHLEKIVASLQQLTPQTIQCESYTPPTTV